MMDALGATLKRKGQQDYRRPAVLRDQHGRRWATQIETETMEPCIAMSPSGWSAPFPALVPPQKYLKTNASEFGLVSIDYDQWIIDLSDSAREYRVHLLEVAQKHFGAAAIRAIEERDPKLRVLAGPPPGALEFVRAMKSGNKWALGLLRPDGLRYAMPPWAAPLADTLLPIETWGGSGVDIDASAAEFPDVEPDGVEDVAARVADRYADADQYLDLEDAIDPDAAPARVTVKKRTR
jgi:hypothetical protein